MKHYLVVITMCGILTQARADIAGILADNYYADGLAENASQVEAEQQACAHAKRELIAYIFGLSTRVQSNVVQVQDRTQLTQTVDVSSDWLNLKSLKQTVHSTKSEQGKVTSLCRVLYPVVEAERERARVDKAREVLDREKLNRVTAANQDPIHFARLTVRTSAPRAKVFVNSVFYGFAPLEIDRMEIGEHTLQAAADGYTTETRTVTLTTGEAKSITITMERQHSSLRVTNLPPRATVWINGIKTTSGTANVEPGEAIIRVEAPFYLPLQDRVSVKQGAAIDHQVDLTPKPVAVSFTSAGERAEVFVNGASIGTTPVTKDLTVGAYNVEFLTSAGIIHKEKLSVTPRAGIQVQAPRPQRTPMRAGKFSKVVLYKDTFLDVRKDYKSFREIPEFSPGSTTNLSIELMEPKEGFIFVNDKLAGKRGVVIDDIFGGTVIRVEAPGYYPENVIVNETVAQMRIPGQRVKLQLGQINAYKIFLLKKRPNYDQRGISVAIGDVESEHFGLTKAKIIGFYQQYIGKIEHDLEAPTAFIGRFSIYQDRVPAVLIEVPNPADERVLEGQVTEILLSETDAVIDAKEIFRHSPGLLLARTIFIGHSYAFRDLSRNTGGLYICNAHGTFCSNHSFGTPFGVKRIEVEPVERQRGNEARYSH